MQNINAKDRIRGQIYEYIATCIQIYKSDLFAKCIIIFLFAYVRTHLGCE